MEKTVIEPKMKDIWKLSPVSKEYSDLSIEELDRAAFGFSRDDITTILPGQLEVKWAEDFRNVVQEQEASGLPPEEWATQIDLSEPIDVIYEDGVFKIDDGHHRYFAALILGKQLNASLEIKDKPHEAIVRNALRQGKKVPEEVVKYYPHLRHIRSQKTMVERKKRPSGRREPTMGMGGIHYK